MSRIRELRFVKNNVSQNNDLLGCEIKASITPMRRGIPKEDARRRASTHFVRSSS